jgi:uncharacterized protein YjbI with pentapeptide repeats
MNRDETVALFLQGREAWNAWAEKMLAEREAMEAADRWAVENHFGILLSRNDQTRAWTDAAAANFSHCLLEIKKEAAGEGKEDDVGAKPVKSIVVDAPDVDFNGFVFPGDANFGGATFTGTGSFGSATFTGDAYFDRVAFIRGAYFESATFIGAANFQSANFTDTAYFGRATFTRGAYFHSATFSGDSDFGSATFTDDTNFRSVTFVGDAKFRSAVFTGETYFSGASFSSDAYFRSATFRNSVSVKEAKFRAEAQFPGVKADRAFRMTGADFALVPAFNQADFRQAPDLDDVEFPLPGFWFGGKAGEVAQYRALRRMAIQGADYEREHMAFKGELRSRRWTVDKWWHPSLWLGMLYDGVADCGRSYLRPAGVWAASIAVFAAFYWWRAAAGMEARCAEAGGSLLQALYLSVKDALVIFGGTRDARVNQAYLCLYDGSTEQPHIPPTVTFVETLAQIPVSAALMFVFLLAVKNRFKIK